MSAMIRWGILGAASIARRQAIPAMQSSPYAKAVAVGSRSLEKAQALAKETGIAKAYGSYQEVIDADDVDAVYIPLPNDQHLPWIERAARAGKHVLCEKPLGLNAREVLRVQELAVTHGVSVMEGVSSYFHPIHRQAAEWIAQGLIGQVTIFRGSLGWSFQGKPEDFRWQSHHGGGALFDLGGYLISTARRLIGQEPTHVAAWAETAGDGVDANVGMMLRFPRAAALLDCGLLSASRNQYEVIGHLGKIVVEQPFGNRAAARTIHLFDASGELIRSSSLSANQFQHEIDAISQALLRGEAPPIPLSESLANARVVDACREAIRTGGVVAVKHGG